GTILAGGRFTSLGQQPRIYISRINADGSVDEAFNPDANFNAVESLAVQFDGKILVGGEFTELAGEPRFYFGRLTSGSAALESIIVDPSGANVTWLRSGSGPEIEWVTFEKSIDGTTYVSLGR